MAYAELKKQPISGGMAIKLFIYSHVVQDQHVYKALRSYVTRAYCSSAYMFVAIEDINVSIDSHSVIFLHKGIRLQLEQVYRVYLIGLGSVDLHLLSYRVYLLKVLQRLGIEVTNTPVTILLCKNKLATYFALKEANLPIIPTTALAGTTMLDFLRQAMRVRNI